MAVAAEHGHFDPPKQMWFCGYWMTREEWMDIHDYAPATQDAQETSD